MMFLKCLPFDKQVMRLFIDTMNQCPCKIILNVSRFNIMVSGLFCAILVNKITKKIISLFLILYSVKMYGKLL